MPYQSQGCLQDIKDCSHASEHTKCPEGYVEWHNWAEKMLETHNQILCQHCGYYAIWVPKRGA